MSIPRYSILLFILSVLTSCSNQQTLVSKNGVFDLSELLVENNKTIHLEGDLEFFYEQFPTDKNDEFNQELLTNAEKVNLPNPTWTELGYPTQGFGTYKFKLKNINNDDLAIRISRIIAAAEIWIDSKKVVSVGKIGKTRDETIANGKPVIFSIPQGSQVVVVIPISNFHHQFGGGFAFGFEIAKKEYLEAKKSNDIAIQVTIASLLILFSLYQIILFFTQKNASHYLYLGLFCLFAALRQFFVGEVFIYNIFPSIPFHLVQMGRYIPFYLCMLFVMLYHHSLFPKEKIKIYSYFLVTIVILGSIYVTFASTYNSTCVATFYQYVALSLLLYGIIFISRAIVNKREYAKVFGLTLLVMIIISVNDILLAMKLIDSFFLWSFGFIIYAMIHTYINQRIQNDRMKNLLSLNTELSSVKEDIDSKRIEITHLMTESLEYLKSKERLTENLKKIDSEHEGVDLKSVLLELKANKIETDKAILLLNNIEELNVEFISELKKRYPTVTKTDIEIACFAKLGLSRKEMANLRNTSIEAIKKNRYRLKKKLNIPAELTLEEFVKTIHSD